MDVVPLVRIINSTASSSEVRLHYIWFM